MNFWAPRQSVCGAASDEGISSDDDEANQTATAPHFVTPFSKPATRPGSAQALRKKAARPHAGGVGGGGASAATSYWSPNGTPHGRSGGLGGLGSGGDLAASLIALTVERIKELCKVKGVRTTRVGTNGGRKSKGELVGDLIRTGLTERTAIAILAASDANGSTAAGDGGGVPAKHPAAHPASSRARLPWRVRPFAEGSSLSSSSSSSSAVAVRGRIAGSRHWGTTPVHHFRHHCHDHGGFGDMEDDEDDVGGEDDAERADDVRYDDDDDDEEEEHGWETPPVGDKSTLEPHRYHPIGLNYSRMLGSTRRYTPPAASDGAALPPGAPVPSSPLLAAAEMLDSAESASAAVAVARLNGLAASSRAVHVTPHTAPHTGSPAPHPTSAWSSPGLRADPTSAGLGSPRAFSAVPHRPSPPLAGNSSSSSSSGGGNGGGGVNALGCALGRLAELACLQLEHQCEQRARSASVASDASEVPAAPLLATPSVACGVACGVAGGVVAGEAPASGAVVTASGEGARSGGGGSPTAESSPGRTPGGLSLDGAHLRSILSSDSIAGSDGSVGSAGVGGLGLGLGASSSESPRKSPLSPVHLKGPAVAAVGNLVSPDSGGSGGDTGRALVVGEAW